ncbi:hypothetical protein Back11_11580 [Paenibacillus baekrokdamisoli]|uniref:Uncharacterized protein n=2 Tax=Paenibacillus baekrokdamisoli TaxID=1712516 RepID=A0A3G9J4Y1_9BACL|nr:RNA polymerase subunit sigma-24 [Paenibacillus baekrokdamisoli]MBB3070459.1 DNA-directed RNA polymerase specialized sigma24 family protein [Paenibacillus baekrokdamisoli]BBH19813.1 hypothetical protein Back11_11580 [Paenibacillus baekrokdamisoli]
MYLNKREQRLETAAHAYLTKYPAGTKAQLGEVITTSGADPEDEKLLQELRGKIEKVIEARTGNIGDYDSVIERISELQDLEQQKEYFDNVLEVLEDYKPGYGKLLRLRYVEDLPAGEVATELKVVRKTFERWRPKALYEYAKISGMS